MQQFKINSEQWSYRRSFHSKQIEGRSSEDKNEELLRVKSMFPSRDGASSSGI